MMSVPLLYLDSTGEWKDCEVPEALDGLDGIIRMQQFTLPLLPEDDADRPEVFGRLGDLALIRYERASRPDDLDEAILLYQQAIVQTTPSDDPSMTTRLENLEDALFRRFRLLANLDDLNSSISIQRQVLERTSEDDSRLPMLLDGLAISLAWRWQSLGDLNDLNNAIFARRRALELIPESDSEMPEQLASLGGLLFIRFERLGELDDLDGAILNQRRALEHTPEGHCSTLKQLRDFRKFLQARYKRLEEIGDLDSVIATARRALELIPESDSEMPEQLTSLRGLLLNRFERLGELEDLNDAISAQSRALELTPESDSSMPNQLNNLGNSLRARYTRLEEIGDLESAIAIARRALKLIPEGHSDLPVQLKPDGHPDMSRSLRFYGNSLLLRFTHLREPDDLNSTISTLHRALDLVPKDRPDRLDMLRDLGTALFHWFYLHKNRPNFARVIGCYMSASLQITGPPSERLQCALIWAELETKHREYGSPLSLLRAYSVVINLLPGVVWLGHSIARRYQESARVAQHVNDAVSAAIALNLPRLAVEWLETGRGLIWSQISSLRTPVDDLAFLHPDLAKEWQELSSKLQLVHLAQLPKATPLENSFLGNQADQHRAVVIEYEACLKKIRACSGFQRFSNPYNEEYLTPMFYQFDGPVVFVNVSSSRCDALILYWGDISLVPLPNLTQNGANELRAMYMSYLRANKVRHRMPALSSPPDEAESGKISKVLDCLWSQVVQPILAVLASEPFYLISNMSQPYMNSGAPRLPHITWCPTGALTQLPLHAAGAHPESGQSGPHVYNFVVSSYTPSLSALVRAQKSYMRELSPPSGVLIVTLPNTPNMSSLPGTIDEGTELQKILSQSELGSRVFNGNMATVKCVEADISCFPWVHFACHGVQRASDPTKSAFVLHDGELTLLTLMGTVAPSAELAFLSACQTATGDDMAPEESAHLTAGMLAVGFQGVIGTMWSIGDMDAPVVVEAYYRKLLEIRSTGTVAPGNTGAAYALHEAVRVLRERVGEKSFLRWAPFVHYGV